MADLDLRKLSAPIEVLRSELSDAYKRLDAKWEEIAECLKALPIPHDVSYAYWEDEHYQDSMCLAWKKCNGKKRICIESYSFNLGQSYSDYEVTTTPYEEWSGEQRVDMLEHVPALFEAAAKVTQKFIEKTKI